MIPTATCQYCGWNGPANRCGPLKNAWERVNPGEIMPAGECPQCNASAMIDEDRPGPRIAIVTTPVPECTTHFRARSTTQSLASVMAMAAGTYTYTVQVMDRHGFRVAVYRRSPYRQMAPDGHLRVDTA